MPSPAITALAAALLRLPERPERALALECGRGDSVLLLAREYPSARVRGVDGSPEAIREARGRVGLDPEGRVAFKPGSPRRIPYPDEQFDLVTTAAGRGHAGELARVLRSGGHLIAVGPPRWPRWRYGRRGLDLIESGEAAGVPFHLARLGAASDRPD